MQLLETMCKAHACMAQKMLDQKLQTDQKLLGYASATMKQKICWELLANNVASICTGKICWELLSNNFASVRTGLTPSNITPTAYRKKKNGTNLPETSGEFMTSYYVDVPSYSSQAAAKLAKTVKLKWRENHF